MSDNDHPVRFFFDYISPNAYIAWTRIHDLLERYGRTVEPVPVLFAALLRANGLLGPAEVEAKWRWMLRDILRKAVRLEIDLRPPTSHPFNPLLALRVSSLPMQDVVRRQLIDELFRAVWAGGPGVTDADTVASLVDRCGLDGKRLVEEAQQPAVKELLRRRTDEALELGVFGVPTVTVGDELFWGFDDFCHLEAHLAGRDPLPHDELRHWMRVRPSARRG